MIAQHKSVVAMLIMWQADGGGPNLLDKHEIGVLLRTGQCPSAIIPVLMH